jgi:DNA-binding NarL/FixJ family response regulator
MEIVRALCAGRRPRDIAKDRSTAVGTVRNQLKEIYRRTDLHSIQAVLSAFCPVIGGRATGLLVEESRIIRR